jgi:hypothetical protein
MQMAFGQLLIALLKWIASTQHTRFAVGGVVIFGRPAKSKRLPKSVPSSSDTRGILCELSHKASTTMFLILSSCIPSILPM